MDAALDGDLDLGAHAIIGGDQDRVGETGRLQIEQTAKAADFGVGAGAARGAHQWLDAVDHLVACVDIDASLSIGEPGLALSLHGMSPDLRRG